MESHGPDSRRAVSAASDRRRVCPLDTSQLARASGVIRPTLAQATLFDLAWGRRHNPTVPTPPILVVVVDGDDAMTSDSLLAYETVTAAEGGIEAPEVKAGAYLVWDAEGRQAELAVE